MKLQTSGDSVVATVEGDGVLLYAVYVIQTPPKIIADFLEVKNQLGTQTLPKPNAFFQRVRAYEYPGNPGSKEVRDKAYSRIVFDLNKLVAYRISPDGNKIKIELIPIVEQDAKASQDSKVSEDTKTQEDPKAQQDAKTQQDKN
jgi:hypothetical protein